MSEIVIFDTSIFIDQLRAARHTSRIQNLRGLVRTSAVVISELWRGVSSSAEKKFLAALEKNHPILLPTSKNWNKSGEILSQIRLDKGFAPHKTRDLHFDVLIALTARAYGARLITSNRADFEIIAAYCPVRLEFWP